MKREMVIKIQMWVSNTHTRLKVKKQINKEEKPETEDTGHNETD